MVWARGHKGDWDHFAAETSDDAWGYQSILGYYRRIEDWQGAPDLTRRGVGGPAYVAQPHAPQPIAEALLSAASAIGIPVYDSPNGEMMEGPGGASIAELRIRDGKRESVFESYVRPLLSRPNLTVLTDALVTRLIFDGKRVTGVEVFVDGERRHFTARCETVLSLGAIKTPKVLMQSGIGPEDDAAGPWYSGRSAPTWRWAQSSGSSRIRLHLGISKTRSRRWQWLRSKTLLEKRRASFPAGHSSVPVGICCAVTDRDGPRNAGTWLDDVQRSRPAEKPRSAAALWSQYQ